MSIIKNIAVPKVGKVYFSANIDAETNRITFDEWHVVRIANKQDKIGKFYGLPPRLTVTAYRKDQFTWVKKSSKHFDWGWKDRISRVDTRTWGAANAPSGLFTTKRAALLSEKSYVKKGYASDDAETNKKLIATIDRAIKRVKASKI